MTDYNCIELARNAADFLKPYLIAQGGKLVNDGLSATREKFFGWLKSKFTKPAQSSALDVAVKSPHDEEAIESLRHQIQRALEQDLQFRKELLEILPPSVAQTATITGNDNKSAQVSGSGNTVNIG
jgi:hypothetical protein